MSMPRRYRTGYGSKVCLVCANEFSHKKNEGIKECHIKTDTFANGAKVFLKNFLGET